MADAWFLKYDSYDTPLYLNELGAFLTDKTIEPPEVQTYMVEIPGRNGLLDLTDALIGEPVYGNRKITMEFRSKSEAASWPSLYSDLLAAVHGKRLRLVFDDDSDYAYEGRFLVEPITALGKNFCGIKIVGDCDPYKKRITLERKTTTTRTATREPSVNFVYNGTTYYSYKVYAPEVAQIRLRLSGKVYVRCIIKGFDKYFVSKPGSFSVQELTEDTYLGTSEGGKEYTYSFTATTQNGDNKKYYGESDIVFDDAYYWVNLKSFEIDTFHENVDVILPWPITVEWTIYTKGAMI